MTATTTNTPVIATTYTVLGKTFSTQPEAEAFRDREKRIAEIIEELWKLPEFKKDPLHHVSPCLADHIYTVATALHDNPEAFRGILNS